jgi:hypothetical protein
MKTEYREEENAVVGIEGGGKGGAPSASPQGQQQGAAGNVIGFEPPLGMISGGMGTGADLIAQGIQEIIGSRIYETWLLRNIHRVDASSAMRMIDTTLVSNGGNPETFTKTTTPMKLKVPYSINEDVARVVAEDASLAETSATFGQYAPNFVTFRTKQVVSNELLEDAKIREILGYQFAENIAESLQAYVLTQIGAAVAGTTRHHRNNLGASVGTTTGIADQMILTALTSSTPIVATWTSALGGAIAAETPIFKFTERSKLMIVSHPAAASTYLLNNGSGADATARAQILNLDRDPEMIASVAGIPWYTDESMPKPSVAGALPTSLPHILIFNPLQVLLAIKSPVRVYLDTESGIASNQTTVHATFRAAGSMLNPKSVAAYSLKTLVANS